MSASLTRRQVLKASAAAGLTTMFAGPLAVAKAAGAGTPRALVRATYFPLLGERLTVDGRLLQLIAVDDLAGALHTKALRGHAEAFALTLVGAPDDEPARVRTVSHPRLGRTSLFVAPVGAVADGLQRYEVVVDRSVGIPARPPAPTPGHAPPPERPGDPQAAAAAVAAGRAKQERAADAQRRRATRRKRRAKQMQARRRPQARTRRRRAKARRPAARRRQR